MLTQFARTLKVPATAHDQEAVVQARLAYLGYSDPCRRCGGSGHYSYNQVSGTRCFRCEGRKYEPARLTKQLLSQVRHDVGAGKLEPYLEELQHRRTAETAVKRLMAAWGDTGISKLRQGAAEDQQLANVNRQMYEMYAAARRLELDWRRATGEDKTVLAQQLARFVGASIAKIEELGEVAKALARE
jgi:hypothetical protein